MQIISETLKQKLMSLFAVIGMSLLASCSGGI